MPELPNGIGRVEVGYVRVGVHRYQDVRHVRVDLILHINICYHTENNYLNSY